MSSLRRGPSNRVSPFTVVLLAVGVCCLGRVGHQAFGTTIVSKRAFDTQRAELRTQSEQESAADAKATRTGARPRTSRPPSRGDRAVADSRLRA